MNKTSSKQTPTTGKIGKSVTGETVLPRSREKKPVMIAMTLASLVAGLLVVINCDRMTHVALTAQEGRGASFHGWPVIFLERRYETLPSFLASSHSYDWPFPPVEGEVRTMNYPNLVIDIVVGSLIIGLTFLVIHRIVLRYERWKATWDNVPAA